MARRRVLHCSVLSDFLSWLGAGFAGCAGHLVDAARARGALSACLAVAVVDRV